MPPRRVEEGVIDNVSGALTPSRNEAVAAG